MFHKWNMRHEHPAFGRGNDDEPGQGQGGPSWEGRFTMFNQWRMGHGHPAFAWGGGHGGPQWGSHGPEGHGGPQWGGHGPGGPPWARGMWGFGRGFPGGPGRGPGGPGGPGGPRAFGRGDMKFQLLALLSERPKHGYEMIKEMEEQAGGFYTPSAGAVYPALQLMEDRGWITSQVADGKKVYTLAEEGRQALAEHSRQAEEFGGPRGRGRGWHGPHGPFGREARPEIEALRHESMEVARLLWIAVLAAAGDPAKLGRLREIVTATRTQLEEVLGPGAAGRGADTPPRARVAREDPHGEPPVI